MSRHPPRRSDRLKALREGPPMEEERAMPVRRSTSVFVRRRQQQQQRRRRLPSNPAPLAASTPRVCYSYSVYYLVYN